MKLSEFIEKAAEYREKYGDVRVLIQGRQLSQYFVLQDVSKIDDADGISVVLKHSKPKINETLVQSMNKDYSTVHYSY